MASLEDLERVAQGLAQKIDSGLPEGVGFTLLIFDYTDDSGERGWMTYISSAKRENMLDAMREFITKHEEMKE